MTAPGVVKTYLHQPNDDDDAKVHARSNLHGALPRHLARRRPSIHLGTCLRPLEGIRAVVHGPEPAAAIRVLHEADALAVAGVVEAAPLIVEEIVEGRGGTRPSKSRVARTLETTAWRPWRRTGARRSRAEWSRGARAQACELRSRLG